MAGPSFCCMFLALMTIVQLDFVTGNVRGLRLRGGQKRNEGRVEVRWNHRGTSKWRVVCEKGWNNKDASAACRQLQYPDGGRKMKKEEAKARNISRGNLHFFHRKFECKSVNENYFLSDCKTKSVTCGDNKKAAKVICHVVLNQTDGTLYNTTAVTATTMGTVIWTDATTQDATTQGQVEEAQSSTTTGQKGQSPSSQKQSKPFPVVAVAAAVGTVLGILLLLAVLLCCYCRRRARNQEDNMTSKLKEDTDQVGMGELAMGKAQEDNSENTYNTIQDPAVIPTAPPSEHDENYSTIPDLQSPPTGGRVDERAPAPPPSQTDVYYSTVRDNGTASTADKTGTPVTVKTTQAPEYAVVKKASKRKENKSEESDKGTAALGPEYAVVKKNPKAEGKGESQYGTVDNIIYEPY